jgi:putative ABC transport system permease protein
MPNRDEIEEEIAQHLEERYEELRARGMSDADARRDASRQLKHLTRELQAAVARPGPIGGPSRDTGASTMLGSIWQDVRYALRTFAKDPGFASIVVITLALGIGATTAIFSVLDGVLLRPLPYPDVERLVVVRERSTAAAGFNLLSVSWPDYLDWRAQNHVFDRLAVFRVMNVNLTGAGDAERLNASLASSDLFATMGIAPIAGRGFVPAEDAAGAERNVVISERLWRSHFNADPGLVGTTIALNGDPHTVVGVMPSGMRYPSRLTDVWLPLGLFVQTLPPRGAHPGLTAIGRLKPGVSLAQADAEMDTIAQRLASQYESSNRNTRVAMTPYYDTVVSNIRPALVVLSGAVVLVLLIACANLANLTLSKAEARHREVAIRAALGARRRRIVQQLLVESVLLASAGGALGALVAVWAVKLFVASQPATVPRIDLIAVDGRVLLFTAIVSVAAGLLFGIMPALRSSAPDLVSTMKDAGRGTGAHAGRVRSVLVVAEVALALMLLVGAGLMVRSFSRLMSVDLGFEPAHVVTARLTLPERRYPELAAWTAFHRDLIQRISAIPGVESAALNSALPLEGGGSEAPVIAEGDAMPTPERPSATTLFQTASPEYFRTMGIQLLAGRTFTDRDTATSSPVVVVDESLAERVLHGGNPIGKRIAFEFTGGHGPHMNPAWREIIGVVRHVRHYALTGEPPFVQLYVPYPQLPSYMLQRRPSMALVARTTLEADLLAAAVRRELSSIDRDIPLYNVQTLEKYREQSSEQQRLSVMLLGGFGGIALALAVIGIYGVLSYTVSQRTQEIGIRLALGATRSDVLRLVVGHGMALTAIGLGIGVAGALAGTRVLTAMLFQVSPRDPATFAILVAALATVALLASLLPGARATRVNPIDALRSE